MRKIVNEQPGDVPSPEATGSAQTTVHEGYGQWYVRNAEQDRIICLCVREADAIQISSALNRIKTKRKAPNADISQREL